MRRHLSWRDKPVEIVRRLAVRDVESLGMDEASIDLRDLLPAVRAGDQQAAAQLIDRLYPLVAKIVRAYLPRDMPEDDWLQDVFVRLLSRLDQYRADAPLEHWVSRLAVNVCLDALRARRRRHELRWADLDAQEAAVVQQAAGANACGEPWEGLAAREVVDKLLDTLSADDRVIIAMLDVERRSVAEVAELTGRTAVGVKVRALRARRRLRGVVAGLLGDVPSMGSASGGKQVEPGKQV